MHAGRGADVARARLWPDRYLLPWDNRAYWGTVVTTKIAAQAPDSWPLLARLLGGQGSIGVVTFARFYALHVLLLPPLTMFLIGLHV